LAHRGSIFLDEITDLPLEMQPKLLRVLEEKEMERLGGTRLTKCDFRLIVASNENLEKCVEQGRFRKDLYYRLNVIPIQIPPLRERKEDIPIIAEHLIEILNKDLGTHVIKITPEVLNIFENYDWREMSGSFQYFRKLSTSVTGYHAGSPSSFFLQRMSDGNNKLQPTLLRRLRKIWRKRLCFRHPHLK
jgi:transcriptional regulator of acetoin/glycerol metabolism